MTERRQKRRFDVIESTNEISQKIIDILNEDFSITYLILQMYLYMKENPIPTDINVYNKFKNDPIGLINDFNIYISDIVNKFLGEYYMPIVANDPLEFTGVDSRGINTFFEKGISEIPNGPIKEPISYLYIVPKSFNQYFPKFIPNNFFFHEIASLSDNNGTMKGIFNKIFDKFKIEMTDKYVIEFEIIASETDKVFYIYFEFV